MKLKYFIVVLISLICLICSCRREHADSKIPSKPVSQLTIQLKKTEYVLGEPILIEFAWKQKKDAEFTAIDYIIGKGRIEFLSDSNVIHEIDMGPISAAKKEGEWLKYYYSIPTVNPDFTFLKGQYLVRAVLVDGKSKEIPFTISD